MSSRSAALSLAFANVGHLFTHLLMLLYPTVVLALEGRYGLSYGELPDLFASRSSLQADKLDALDPRQRLELCKGKRAVRVAGMVGIALPGDSHFENV